MTALSSPRATAGSSALRPDGRREMIVPADVRGRFLTRRRLGFAVLLAIYVALPLVEVGGHPALHLDVGARRFYVLGASFDAQDFWRVLFLLTAAGATLLAMTAWLGRAWCGWACPQTVFLEGLYRPVERWIEGPRERRLKLRGTRWTAERLARTIAKHGAFIALSLLLSHVALSLFLSAHDLRAMVLEGPARHLAAFAWSMAVTGLLYGNFAWFREQLCLVLCPYGRLQAALIDRDSKIVGYDARRGEPRGRLVKAQVTPPPSTTQLPVLPSPLLAPLVTPPKGDCVDCLRCVQVCPTGIDIRNGLQMECIACAQCIDACDEVMFKIHRAPGLIRYDSLRGLSAEASTGQPSGAGAAGRTVLRPRLVAYGALVVLSLGALALSLWTRASLEVTLLRAPGAPFVREEGRLRNQFVLHVVNKRGAPSVIRIHPQAAPPTGAEVLVPTPELTLESLESARVPIFVFLPEGSAAPAKPLGLEIEDGTGEPQRVWLRVLAPPR